MNKLKGIKLLLTAVIIACCGNAMGQAMAIVTSVEFGTTPPDGGACYGKGLCSIKSTSDPLAAEMVHATFQLSPSGSVISIIFSLSELNTKQPYETQYISAGTNTYTFMNQFNFTDPIFSPLSLPTGSNINSGTPNTTVIDGDQVTISYTYSHD